MPFPFQAIAFDADDTLWHNETYFRSTEAAFRALLRPYHEDAWIDARLFETEMRNLKRYGYGIKAFMLSMIETAIELTESRISAGEIQQILKLGQDMLARPVELLPHVEEVLRALQGRTRLILITKGDLLDQESKLARSGLGDCFEAIEVVSEKDVATYGALLKRHGIAPEQFLMIGNSVKSDILPILALGAQAVHIPCEDTWVFERVEGDLPDFPVLEHLGELLPWLESVRTGA